MNKIVVDNIDLILDREIDLNDNSETRMLCLESNDGCGGSIYIDFYSIPKLIKALKKSKKLWWDKYVK